MIGHLIDLVLPEIIHLLELIGIVIVTTGSVKTLFLYVRSFYSKKRYRVQIELGHYLAIGLEYKMGAEILRTVLIQDISEIWILGATIVMRAVLSLLIHFEMKAEMEHEEGGASRRGRRFVVRRREIV